MTYGTVLFQAQAPSFGISIPATAKSITGPLFLQGVGGIFAVPLIQRIGRLPVLFYSQFICAFMVLGAALSPNYATFTAFRCLQGFFNTAQQVVGLGFVHDMDASVRINTNRFVADIRQVLLPRACQTDQHLGTKSLGKTLPCLRHSR